MATVVHSLGPRDAQYPATNLAGFKAVSGTNFPVESLAFDSTTSETVYFRFKAVNYASGNITVRIQWYTDTVSTGAIVMECALQALTPDTDTQDIETDSFATATNATDTHLGTTIKRLHEMTVTVSNLDSVADGDYCVLRLARLPADASDTMADDAQVTSVQIEYLST